MNSLRLRDVAVQLPDEQCWAVRMRRAMREALTEQDFSELARGLMEKAKAGDVAALQLILGQLTAGPKTLVVNQTFQPRKKRKSNGSKPNYVPGPEEIADGVAKLRRAKGLPETRYPVGDEG